MFKKKYLPILSIATVSVLLASVFLSSVILAQNGGSEYDPWLGYNENARAVPRVGIVGHATKLLRLAVNVSIPAWPGQWNSSLIWIDGYAKVTVLLRVYDPSTDTFFHILTHDYSGASWKVDQGMLGGMPEDWIRTYDVMNQQISVEIINTGSSAVTAYVDVYLMA